MNILIINASPRSNGTTAFVINRIIKHIQKPGIEIDHYCLGEMNIKYCLGCRKCEQTKSCVIKDDMALFYEKLTNCDCLLVASPSYWGDITGQLKVFIDRNLYLCNTKTGTSILPKGKVGISIAIRSGQKEQENMHIIETIEHYLKHLDITPILSLSITNANAPHDIESNKKTLENIDRFCLEIETKTHINQK